MDDAAARREIRRRRILENSKNRLQLISGKSSEESFKDSHPKTVPIPSLGSEIGSAETLKNIWTSEPSIMNGVIITDPSPNIPFTASSLSSDVLSTSLSTDPMSFAVKTDVPTRKVSFWEKIVHSQYDIVMLSILIQIIYSFTSVPVENHYFFMPFAIYTSTKLLLMPQPEPSRMMDMLLLLNGLTSHKVQRFVYIGQFFAKVSQDLGMFLFTTICMQYLVMLLQEQIST